MPRKLLKRWIPDPKTIREKPGLQFLGKLLEDPNLFHLNRHSVSTAFLVGIFICFLPIPGQMPLAALCALWLRCNLPLSVALVWISNPVTFPVIFYSAYKVGAWILNTPKMQFAFEMSWEWLTSGFLSIWQPLILGCLTFAVCFSALGYVLIQVIWRWHVSDRWKKRQKRRDDQSTPS